MQQSESRNRVSHATGDSCRSPFKQAFCHMHAAAVLRDVQKHGIGATFTEEISYVCSPPASALCRNELGWFTLYPHITN